MTGNYITFIQAIRIVRAFMQWATLKDAKDFVEANCKKVYSDNSMDGQSLVSKHDVIEALLDVIDEWSTKSYDAVAKSADKFIRDNPKTTLKILMDSVTDMVRE